MFPTPMTPSTQTARPGQSVTEPATRSEAGVPCAMPRKTIALGAIGSALLAVGAIGAGGVLVHDPVLAGSPFSWVRYGHGRDLATAVVYAGFFMVVWAWVRLGRGVLAGLVSSRCVLAAAAAWITPLLIAPPLFTRDAYSYLAQGALAAKGIDPYMFGPEVMPGPITDNVHYFWQGTPAPYGPLFILLAKTIYLITGNGLITGVVVMRLVLISGLVLVCWALPGLVRHLGGRLPVAVFLPVFTAVTLVAGVTLGWIPALQAPSAIVNWLSIPTGVGEAIHGLVSVVFDVDKMPFITVTRGIGLLLLVVIALKQWWRARAGGPDAVRRAAIVLFAV